MNLKSITTYLTVVVIISGCFRNTNQQAFSNINYAKLINDYNTIIINDDSVLLKENVESIKKEIMLNSNQISDSACGLFTTYLLATKEYESILLFLDKKNCGKYDNLQINLVKHILAEQEGDFSNKYMTENINEIKKTLDKNPDDTEMLFNYYNCYCYIHGVYNTTKVLEDIINKSQGETKVLYENVLEVSIYAYKQNPDLSY
jgi:hypothetical protein